MGYTISVVTVTHNDSVWVARLIESLGASLRECSDCFDDAEVVIVDNASLPEEIERLEDVASRHSRGSLRVRLVGLSKNYGYSGGVNAGVRLSKGDIVAVSNPDIRVGEGFAREVARIYAGLRDEVVGRAIIAPKILLGDTDIINSTGMSMHVAGYGLLNHLGDDSSSADEAVPVLAPHGAFFLAMRDILLDLGPFDLTYFAFLEDLDLGLRAWLRGYLVLYAPTVMVRHYWGMTWGRGLSETKYYHAEKNRLATLIKDVPTDVLTTMIPSITLSEAISLAYSVIAGYPNKKAEIYAYILRKVSALLGRREARGQAEALKSVLLATLTHEFRHTEFPTPLARAVNGLYALTARLVSALKPAGGGE